MEPRTSDVERGTADTGVSTHEARTGGCGLVGRCRRPVLHLSRPSSDRQGAEISSGRAARPTSRGPPRLSGAPPCSMKQTDRDFPWRTRLRRRCAGWFLYDVLWTRCGSGRGTVSKHRRKCGNPVRTGDGSATVSGHRPPSRKAATGHKSGKAGARSTPGVRTSRRGCSSGRGHQPRPLRRPAKDEASRSACPRTGLVDAHTPSFSGRAGGKAFSFLSGTFFPLRTGLWTQPAPRSEHRVAAEKDRPDADHFRVFYEEQLVKVRKKVHWTLRVIEDIDRIPAAYFKCLDGTDGLYEIRVQFGTDIFRIFCFFDKQNLVVINGFQKKTQKTPQREIERATRIRKEYYEEKKHRFSK